MVEENPEDIETESGGFLQRLFGSPLLAGSLVILFLIMIIVFAVFGGYRAGLNDRNDVVATTEANEMRLQYQLAVEDLAAARYLFAIDRLEYILSVESDFADAANMLVQARNQAQDAAVPPTAAPTPTLMADDVTPEEMFAGVEVVYTAGDWHATVQQVTALRATFPEFMRVRVDGILFVALRSRGIERIDNDELELGIFDLEQAEQIGPLDVEAQQYQQWAWLYINGTAYWGFNWPRAIEAFETLYLLGPFFKDTTPRLSAAHVAYGDELALAGDLCNAALEYAAAMTVIASDTVEEKRAEADTGCTELTQTPGGEATLDPNATPDPEATPAEGELALTPQASTPDLEEANATPTG